MAPVPPPTWPIPSFLFRVDDLNHLGARLFFDSVNPYDALRDAVLSSFKVLYTEENVPRNVQSILLVLKPMPGVAHTFGSKTHKEIHFSLDWIETNAHRARDEILGVLTHEIVHCYQYDAHGSCPGGLIEGIADFVRLQAQLSPPHWHRSPPSDSQKWDAGYEKTAYFLEWINAKYGSSTIQSLNNALCDRKYHRRIFRGLTGRPLRKLWALYRGSFPVKEDTDTSFRVYTPDPPAESESEDEGEDCFSPNPSISPQLNSTDGL